jgi:hypothetical protein
MVMNGEATPYPETPAAPTPAASDPIAKPEELEKFFCFDCVRDDYNLIMHVKQ